MIEFAKGFGRFFLNPVLYFALILAVTAGILRVKEKEKILTLGYMILFMN